MTIFRKLAGPKPGIDWKTALITVVSTLVIMVSFYFNVIKMDFLQSFLLFFAIPMLIILIVFREKPAAYGFSIGDWKAGLIITLISIILAAPLIWLAVRFSAAMQGYYAVQSQKYWLGITILQLFSWEFLFRGWILFGYEKKFGGNAIWLQAVPFALAHLTKPSIETLSTIFGGFFFGWVAWRTRSFLYPLIIHVFVSAYAIWFAMLMTAPK